MDDKKIIPLYRSFYEAAKELPKDAAADFLLAVCAAYLGDEIPELSGVAKSMFLIALPNIESSKKRAEGQKKRSADNLSGNADEIPDNLSANSEANADNLPSLLFTPSSNTPSSKKIGDRVQGKGEDQRKVQWAENVTMTNEEHAKLVSAHGEADTERMIVILDNYKGSTGKRYKSDYRAILSWVVDRLAEEKAKKPKGPLTENTPGDLELRMLRRMAE